MKNQLGFRFVVKRIGNVASLAQIISLLFFLSIFLTLPVIADDFIILLNFTAENTNKSLLPSFLYEFKSQWANSESRFLPVGWFASAALLTLSKAINTFDTFDLEKSWIIVRLIFISLAVIISWRNFSEIRRFHGLQKLAFPTYLMMLCLTLQLHALWGHDAILSYTSTVFSLVILVTTYIRLLETSFSRRFDLYRIFVLISALLVHELALAISSYLAITLLRRECRMRNVLRLLPDLVIVLVYFALTLVNSLDEDTTYSGTEVGSFLLMPLISIGQLIGSFPVSTWPLYLYSTFTEIFKPTFFLVGFIMAMPILVFYKFRKPDPVDEPSKYSHLLFSRILLFLLFLALGTAFSQKYQTAQFLIPGNLYISYAFGWILFPFMIYKISLPRLEKFYRVIPGLLIVNTIIFASSSQAIVYKFENNSKILTQIEAVKGNPNCSFVRNMLNANYPSYYSEMVKESFETVQPLSEKCFDG